MKQCPFCKGFLESDAPVTIDNIWRAGTIPVSCASECQFCKATCDMVASVVPQYLTISGGVEVKLTVRLDGDTEPFIKMDVRASRRRYRFLVTSLDYPGNFRPELSGVIEQS